MATFCPDGWLRRRPERRRAVPFASLSLLVVLCACGDRGASHADRAGLPPAESTATVERDLEVELAAGDHPVDVLVMLREEAPSDGDVERRVQAIRRTQDDVVAAQREGFSVSRRYGSVPAFAARLTKQALDRLRVHPSVAYVQLDRRGHGQLNVAVPAVGADQVKSLYGLTGKGIRVAVLDTGVDTTHPDLSDSIVAQHCFTQFDCGGGASESTTAEDDNGHGSNVAGIVTSNGVVSSHGFAPDADIVVVKVNDANDSGTQSDWLAGLDWVYQNLSTLKVKVVNLSFGLDQLYPDAATCDAQQPTFAAAIKNLVDAGVTVVAASGNLGSSTMTASPACNTGVIAVGATYDSSVAHEPPNYATYQARWGAGFASCGDDSTKPDQITCFTNSNARLDIVAPGAPIVSDSLNGATEAFFGTSQASPVVAGVAALLLQCNPALSPADVKKALVGTGVALMDPKNGMSFPSLRALAAVRSVCFKDAGTAALGDAGEGGVDATAADGSAVGAREGGTAGNGSMTTPPANDADAAPGGSLGPAGSNGDGMDAAGQRGRPGADGGLSPGAAYETPGAEQTSGCSCETAGGARDRSGAAGWVSLLACAAWVRARRRGGRFVGSRDESDHAEPIDRRLDPPRGLQGVRSFVLFADPIERRVDAAEHRIRKSTSAG